MIKKNEHLVEQLQYLQAQKDETEGLNKQIVQQIKVMKEAIADSRQSEELNKQLLEKSKQKTDKIQSLRQKQLVLYEQLKSQDEEVRKLTAKVRELREEKGKNVQMATLGQTEFVDYEQKYKELKDLYEREVVEHAKYLQQIQTNSS